MNKMLAVALIVVGLAMLIWSGFTYTKKVNIVNTGPIQISAGKQKSVAWPPYLGGILIVGGIIMLATAKRNS